MSWALFIAAAFLLGSVPTGLLLARSRGVDIRRHGSKNIGATNVGRVLGRRWGALCFALDAAKGGAPALAAGLWHGALGGSIAPGTAAAWIAVVAAAVLGHMYSPWVGFKGGKGVATGLGSLLAVFPYLTVPALTALGLWLVCLRACRMVGLSSCIAAASLPLSTLAWTRAIAAAAPPGPRANASSWAVFVLATALLAALVIFKHRGNLARTWAGTEPKIGRKPSAASQN